jgi:hypothetical protein
MRNRCETRRHKRKTQGIVNITQITVSYGETQSLPKYSNVKPSLTLTATIDDGESAADAEAALWQLAKDSVHAQIDAALEANDRPAKYDPAPRYQVMRTYWDRYNRPKDEVEPPKIVVILPNEVELKEQFGQRLVHAGYPESRKLRYGHALRVARESARELGASLIDCADGELMRLAVVLAPPEPTGTAPEHLEDTLDYTSDNSSEEAPNDLD